MAEEIKEHHEHEHHEHHESHEHEHHEHAKEEHQQHEHAHEKHEHEKEHEHKQEHEKKSEPVPSEKKELRDGRVSMVAFTLAGIAMGFASDMLKAAGISNYITATLGLIFLVVLMIGMQKAFKRKTKFFLGGVLAYIFVWLVFWILFYNI